MSEGLPLARTGHREAGGKLFFQTNLINVTLPAGLPQGKADNQILGVVQALREQQPERDVVLVSKDINMRIKARALGPARRGLLQRQDAGRRRPALHRRAAAAGRLLGPARQDDGELAAGRPHLLPHQRADGAGAAGQPVRLPRGAGRGAAVRQGHRDHRQDRGAAHAEGVHAPEERRLGRDGAQPRAELRAQPADGPGVRLHHPHRHRRAPARR